MMASRQAIGDLCLELDLYIQIVRSAFLVRHYLKFVLAVNCTEGKEIKKLVQVPHRYYKTMELFSYRGVTGFPDNFPIQQ